jgi:pimeloyl-ACP methyl ester carboxylesterase
MPDIRIHGARLEYAQIAGVGPPLVMLHEGLGSLAMWRDFPAQLAAATGCAVVAYSRRGYGRSEPLAQPRTVRYMHEEAQQVLPELLQRLEITRPVLFGHSDGGSIALIHAGSGHPVAGIVALAPHVMVEELSIASIAAARTAFTSTDLRARLARYHDDVDGAFWGWNDIWLQPDFRAWNIEEFLPRIECPILALQGEEDEYGTMEQIERIARAAHTVELVRIASCRHSPHRDQPATVLERVARWLAPLKAIASREPADGH